MRVMNELTVYTVVLAVLALALTLEAKNVAAMPDELETKFVVVAQTSSDSYLEKGRGGKFSLRSDRSLSNLPG